MSEMEMKDEVETEKFTDELSDDALDRDGGGGKFTSYTSFCARCFHPVLR